MRTLSTFRAMCWQTAILEQSHRLDHHLNHFFENIMSQDLDNTIMKIGSIMSPIVFKEDSEICPLTNIRVLIFFGTINKEYKVMENMQEHFYVRKILLDEMTAGRKMLSLNRMVEILILGFGNRAKECGVCHKSINPVTILFTLVPETTIIAGKRPFALGVAYCFLQVLEALFLCGSYSCAMRGVQGISRKLQIHSSDPASFAGFCDYCNDRCDKLHRCTGCLTKEYCGTECRDKDWQTAHKQLCGKGDLERKKKDRSRVRKEKMINSVDGYYNDFKDFFY